MFAGLIQRPNNSASAIVTFAILILSPLVFGKRVTDEILLANALHKKRELRKYTLKGANITRVNLYECNANLYSSVTFDGLVIVIMPPRNSQFV